MTVVYIRIAVLAVAFIAIVLCLPRLTEKTKGQLYQVAILLALMLLIEIPGDARDNMRLSISTVVIVLLVNTFSDYRQSQRVSRNENDFESRTTEALDE